MAAKGFAGVDIRQVNFNKGNVDAQQGIAQRHAGVRERCGVNNDEVDAFVASVVNALDQLRLRVTLQALQVVSGRGGRLLQIDVDVGQCLMPVNRRLAGAEQVQIGAVQHENRRHTSPKNQKIWRSLPQLKKRVQRNSSNF